MRGSDASAALGRSANGGAETSFDRKYPQYHGDGMLALSAEDGHPGSPIEVAVVAHEVNTLEQGDDLGPAMAAMGRPERILRLFKFHLMVTDARVIFVQDEPEAPGVHMAGHIRYPWVRSIEYRPKQSFLLDAVLMIDYCEAFPGSADGTWFHRLELTFPKRIDPGPIAHEIVTRLARHHLRHGAPDQATEALAALAQSSPAPPPAKGELASYYPPAFVLYPGGAEYLGDDAPAIPWELSTA